MLSKFGSLYSKLDARRTVAVAFNGVSDAVKNYSSSDLPLGAKLAIPATVLAIPFAGGHAAGIAAFGTAVGVPVLLLIFIGSAGITAIIEACATNEMTRAYVKTILNQIAWDEAYRRFRAASKVANKERRRLPFDVKCRRTGTWQLQNTSKWTPSRSRSTSCRFF
jgi:restriction system protein